MLLQEGLIAGIRTCLAVLGLSYAIGARKQMGKYKVCENCHIAFDKRLTNCPSCGKIIQENIQTEQIKEGTGRKNKAGGAACEYCPDCYGSEDWCPFMDD